MELHWHRLALHKLIEDEQITASVLASLISVHHRKPSLWLQTHDHSFFTLGLIFHQQDQDEGDSHQEEDDNTEVFSKRKLESNWQTGRSQSPMMTRLLREEDTVMFCWHQQVIRSCISGLQKKRNARWTRIISVR